MVDCLAERLNPDLGSVPELRDSLKRLRNAKVVHAKSMSRATFKVTFSDGSLAAFKTYGGTIGDRELNEQVCERPRFFCLCAFR